VDLGDIGISDEVLHVAADIGLSSQAENQCKVGDAVPTSVDLGDVGISDEVLHAAADLSPEKETNTTVPPTEALPISPTLPTQGNIIVNLSPILPTADNIGFSSQVHNQSEVGPGNALPTGKKEEVTATGPIPVDMGDVGTTDELLYAAAELGTQDKKTTTMSGDGTKVHYDASDVVEDVATVAVGPSAKRQLRQHVSGRNDGALVDVPKCKSQKKKVHVEALFDGPKDDVSKRKVLKKKVASKEEIMEIDEFKSDNSGPNNLSLDALVEFPNWINRGDQLDWIGFWCQISWINSMTDMLHSLLMKKQKNILSIMVIFGITTTKYLCPMQ
jgi:hypothetical protein